MLNGSNEDTAVHQFYNRQISEIRQLVLKHESLKVQDSDNFALRAAKKRVRQAVEVHFLINF